MKFAWKVTLAALCILLLSTGVGSYLLISLSFQSALEREIDMAQEEMQMLRVSYEAVCDARGITLENVAERGRSLERTLKEAAYLRPPVPDHHPHGEPYLLHSGLRQRPGAAFPDRPTLLRVCAAP